MKSLLANDFINFAYVMKPPENPQRTGLESLQVGEHMEIQAEWCFEGAWVLPALPHTLHYASPPPGSSQVTSFYNKPQFSK